MDELDQVLVDLVAPWATADNYNPTHPFPAIDEVAVAISSAGSSNAS